MAEDELLIDGFALQTCVGSGGTSQVWEVMEQGSGRRMAMKIVYSNAPEYQTAKSVLRHEAEVFKTLDHPNIVKFERCQVSRDWVYLLMEYFRAPNIKNLIKSDMQMLHVRVRPFMEQACLAIAHVHQKGWIHRDVKPDNLLMNRAAEVRLVDFSLSVRQSSGLGRLLGSKKFKVIQGTRTYIAPETIRRQAPTPATDLYSLGVTFFEVLTGRPPYQGTSPQEVLHKHLQAPVPSPSEFNNNVTPEMDRLVTKMLSKRPEARFSDMGDVLSELRRIRIFKVDVEEKKTSEQEENANIMQQLKEGGVDSRLDAHRSRLLVENPEFAQELEEQRIAREKKRAEAKAKIIAGKSSQKEKGGAPSPNQPQQPGMMPPVQFPMQYPGAMPMPPGMMPPAMMGPAMPPYGAMPAPGPMMMPMPGPQQPAYPPGMLPPASFPTGGAGPMGYPQQPGPGMLPPPGGTAPPAMMPASVSAPAPLPARTPQPAPPSSPKKAAPPAKLASPPPSPQKKMPDPAPAAAAARKDHLPEDDDLPFMTELPDVL